MNWASIQWWEWTLFAAAVALLLWVLFLGIGWAVRRSRGPTVINRVDQLVDQDPLDLRVDLDGPPTLVARKYVANLSLGTDWTDDPPRGEWHRLHRLQYLIRFVNRGQASEPVSDITFRDSLAGGNVVPGSIRVRLNGRDVTGDTVITPEQLRNFRNATQVLTAVGIENGEIEAGQSLDITYHVRASGRGGAAPDADLSGAPSPGGPVIPPPTPPPSPAPTGGPAPGRELILLFDALGLPPDVTLETFITQDDTRTRGLRIRNRGSVDVLCRDIPFELGFIERDAIPNSVSISDGTLQLVDNLSRDDLVANHFGDILALAGLDPDTIVLLPGSVYEIHYRVP